MELTDSELAIRWWKRKSSEEKVELLKLVKIQNYNFDILELDMSEFEKINGGLSCLSLRF